MKLIKTSLLLIIILSLFACNGDSKNGVNIDDQNNNQIETVLFDENIYQNQFIKAIEYLNACYNEEFNVQYNNISLAAAYKDVDNQEIAFLYPSSEELDDNYYEDMLAANYYLVTNYSSVDEIRNELAKYLSQEVIDSTNLEFDFMEFDGQLYLVRAGRAYGNAYCDLESISLDSINDEETIRNYRIDYYEYEEFANQKLLEFMYIDGKWLLNEVRDIDN